MFLGQREAWQDHGNDRTSPFHHISIYPRGTITYPTFGKAGKSSTQKCLFGKGYGFVPRRVSPKFSKYQKFLRWNPTPPNPLPHCSVSTYTERKIPTGAREAFKKGQQWASGLFGGPGHCRVSTLEKRYLHPLELNLNHFGRWAWYKSLVLPMLMKTRIAEAKMLRMSFCGCHLPLKKVLFIVWGRLIMFYPFQLWIGSFNFDVMKVTSSA